MGGSRDGQDISDWFTFLPILSQPLYFSILVKFCFSFFYASLPPEEGWYLTEKNQAKLKGWNARNLAIITGREIAEESSEPTVDILKMLKARRLRWVGHVLRGKETNLVRQVLMEMEQPYSPGSVLMNAPKHESMAELVELANDREGWREIVCGLDSDSSVSSVYSRGLLREIRHI